MKYTSAKSAAERNNCSVALVKRLAKANKIPGAYKLNADEAQSPWLIPLSWVYVPTKMGRPASTEWASTSARADGSGGGE